MTLVEALAGSLLLGTLLVAILIAMGQLSVQARRAENRTEACAVLDDLLQHWWDQPQALPRNGDGEVPGHTGWRWKTAGIPNEEAVALAAEVVSVEVFAPQAQDKAPAARVELLMSAKPPGGAPPPAPGSKNPTASPKAPSGPGNSHEP